MREFRIHELANWIDWWPDLVIREGPFWENGYFTIQDKPGYGVEINPDVAKAHLAPGETLVGVSAAGLGWLGDECVCIFSSRIK